MAEQITNYQCPACTGPLNFSAETGKVQCDYCGSSFDIAEIEALYAEKDAEAAKNMAEAEAQTEEEETFWDDSDMQEDWGEDANGMKTYSCPSCTAELICDGTTAATSCPYCGNPTVVPGQFSGALKPDYIIPFKLNKEQAVQALKEHYKGKFFLPKAFTRENQLQKIQGVYVPFWLFDGEASGSVRFGATRSIVTRSGDYEVRTTDHYEVFRSGGIAFEKIPVDASSKMPDAHMDSIEPFDYQAIQPFSTAYLPGFLADKYDVDVDKSSSRADERCRETLEQALQNTVLGYDTCVTEQKNIRINRGKVHYALLPVWMLTTQWEGKNYLYAINGQTGKPAGDLPISMAKVVAMFAGITASLSVVLSLILSWLF